MSNYSCSVLFKIIIILILKCQEQCAGLKAYQLSFVWIIADGVVCVCLQENAPKVLSCNSFCHVHYLHQIAPL